MLSYEIAIILKVFLIMVSGYTVAFNVINLVFIRNSIN